MEPIQVFSTNTCPYCHALMDWLDEQKIPYEVIDANMVPGINTVPVSLVNGQKIVGFDRPAILKALQDVKKD